MTYKFDITTYKKGNKSGMCYTTHGIFETLSKVSIKNFLKDNTNILEKIKTSKILNNLSIKQLIVNVLEFQKITKEEDLRDFSKYPEFYLYTDECFFDNYKEFNDDFESDIKFIKKTEPPQNNIDLIVEFEKTKNGYKLETSPHIRKFTSYGGNKIIYEPKVYNFYKEIENNEKIGYQFYISSEYLMRKHHNIFDLKDDKPLIDMSKLEPKAFYKHFKKYIDAMIEQIDNCKTNNLPFSMDITS